MIPAVGTSAFAYGVHLHQPDAISNNVNRKASAEAAHARAEQVSGNLRAASVGVPAPSIDNLRPQRT